MKYQGFGVGLDLRKNIVVLLPSLAVHDIRCSTPGCTCGKLMVRVSLSWIVWTAFLDVFLQFGRRHEN
jgi:hypothetical protein